MVSLTKLLVGGVDGSDGVDGSKGLSLIGSVLEYSVEETWMVVLVVVVMMTVASESLRVMSIVSLATSRILLFDTWSAVSALV
jgi:hypothetical protein